MPVFVYLRYILDKCFDKVLELLMLISIAFAYLCNIFYKCCQRRNNPLTNNLNSSRTTTSSSTATQSNSTTVSSSTNPPNRLDVSRVVRPRRDGRSGS